MKYLLLLCVVLITGCTNTAMPEAYLKSSFGCTNVSIRGKWTSTDVDIKTLRLPEGVSLPSEITPDMLDKLVTLSKVLCGE